MVLRCFVTNSWVVFWCCSLDKFNYTKIFILGFDEVTQSHIISLSFINTILALFYMLIPSLSWWRHKMKTFSALLAICAGNSPVIGEFPARRPVTRSFHVFFDLRLNERLSKQSWGWWFETLSRPLWRHSNDVGNTFLWFHGSSTITNYW